MDPENKYVVTFFSFFSHHQESKSSCLSTQLDSTDEARYQVRNFRLINRRAARECIFRDYLRFIYPDQVVCRLQSDSVALIPKFHRRGSERDRRSFAR